MHFIRRIVIACLILAPISAAGGKLKPLAALSVVDLRAKITQTTILRAVVVREEIYDSLVVELIRRGNTEGDPDTLVKQKRVEFLPKSGAVVDRTRPMAWKGSTFHLTVLSESSPPVPHRCKVSMAKKSFGRARCKPVGGK